MALNPQESVAMNFAADGSSEMNEDSMLTPLETETNLFDIVRSSPATGENGGASVDVDVGVDVDVDEYGDSAGAGPLPAESAGSAITDFERGPLLAWPQIDTNAPSDRQAHQAQQGPGLVEPVPEVSHIAPSVSARTPGSRQVRIRSSSVVSLRRGFLPRHRTRRAHEEPFVLTNPFRAARAGSTNVASTEVPINGAINLGEESRGREGSANLTAVAVGMGTTTTPARTRTWASVSSMRVPEQWVEGWVKLVYIDIALLHLPALYFTRVAKVFEDARVSKREVERVAKSGYGVVDALGATAPSMGGDASASASASMGTGGHVGAVRVGTHVVMTPPRWTLPTPPDEFITLSPALQMFKESWEAFVDSLLKEWKTLNLVSALLLTAILTLFQLPAVNTDPVSRNTSFLSLVCALMSLSYGCVYTIRFGSLKSISRALSWADKAEESKSSIWWSVWVFLAIPSVWLAWSMLWFIITILAFVWRSGAEGNLDQHPLLSFDMALAPRVIITAHFVLGLVYFVLIVKTLQTYGTLKEQVTDLDSGLDNAERGEAREEEMTDEKPSALGLMHIRSRSE